MPTRRTPYSRKNPKAPRAYSRTRRHAGGPTHASPGSFRIGGRASHGADRPQRRPTELDRTAISWETSSGSFSLTRRQLLIGAAAIVGIGIVGAGGSAIYQQVSAASSGDVSVLEVPEGAVTTTDSLTMAETSACVSLIGNFELTYGTQLWCNDGAVAACLVPSDTSTPLASAALLWLSSGSLQTVLAQAVGDAEGFDIYDVRATAQALVWVEQNILEGTWRIYSAALADGTPGQAALMQEGTTDEWEVPLIAAVGGKAFWQVLPNIEGPFATEASTLNAAQAGDAADAHVVCESDGRMCTAPYALSDSLVITPRAATSGTYYRLVLIDAESEAELDSLVLPQAMRPQDAGYGDTGFTFTFDAIYNYGEGISQLGSYAPASDARGADYSGAPWFRYTRTPGAAPAWCGRYFVAKSASNVVGVDFASGSYFVLDREDGADDYGDYIASTGAGDTLVTFSNIDSTPIVGDARRCCLVRVWAPL